VISKARRLLRRFYAVPWCVPAWGWQEFAVTVKALVTGRAVHGKSAEKFADSVAAYLGVGFAVPVNRGRTAIELALRAMAIGPGDDVVIPSFVCRSVLDAVLSTGASPVFADVDETLNVSSSSISAALTPRTKCAIVAHLFGTPAPIDEIEELLTSRGVALIDDAAQALGASRAGRPVGSFGRCGIVSCGPGKPLAGAAGGLLVTNDEQLYERCVGIELPFEPANVVRRRALAFWIFRRFRRYTLPFGILIDRVAARPTEAPHTSAALSELDAAIAVKQFESLSTHAAERRRNANRLLESLSALRGKLASDISPLGMAVKLVYILPQNGPTTEQAIDLLANHGIEAQGGYAPLHREFVDDACVPNTASVWRRVLCVPLETDPRADRVIAPADNTAWSPIPLAREIVGTR
jgi:dTDP-4-amino-4,6-dideoxygalactose transaminase